MKTENKQELVDILVSRIRGVHGSCTHYSVDALKAISKAVLALIKLEKTKTQEETK